MTLGLRHPNIVEVYDAGVNPISNLFYIAMAYLPYGNLKKEIERYNLSGEPFPIDRALEITRQIASALAYAHQRGLIHRDVKPSNILRAPGEHYVLSDFGIALALDATRLTRSSGDRGLGTPEYMSPEQIERQPVDGRSDVYSLGVVLYELIAGVAPFKADSPLVVLMKHVHEAPPPIQGYRADVPRPVCKLLEQALAKDPRQRYASAMMFATALQNILEGQPEPRHHSWNYVRVIPLAMLKQRRVKLCLAMSALVVVILFATIVLSHRQQTATPRLIRAPQVVLFTANSSSVIVRPHPNDTEAAIRLIELGETSEAIGRTDDDRWLLLKLNKLPLRQGWVQLTDGHLQQGQIQSLPHVPQPIHKETIP